MIKTAFKINDKIHFIHNNKVEELPILGISTYQGTIHELHLDRKIEQGEVVVIYHCGTYLSVDESRAFATQDDLKKELFKKEK